MTGSSGAGAFGTALSVALARGGHDVTLLAAGCAADAAGRADANPAPPGATATCPKDLA